MTETIYPGVQLDEGPAGHAVPGVSTATSGLLGTALIKRLQTLVPAAEEGWQDRHEHDPGVALLELMAYLTEQLASRSQQVPRHGQPYAERLEKAALLLNKRSG